MESSTSSSGHHKSYLNYCNYYIKIGLVPAKSSRRTTFRTPLLFRGEVGSVLSLEDATNALPASSRFRLIVPKFGTDDQIMQK
jgi:hypothetical protein